MSLTRTSVKLRTNRAYMSCDSGWRGSHWPLAERKFMYVPGFVSASNKYCQQIASSRSVSSCCFGGKRVLRWTSSWTARALSSVQYPSERMGVVSSAC